MDVETKFPCADNPERQHGSPFFKPRVGLNVDVAWSRSEC